MKICLINSFAGSDVTGGTEIYLQNLSCGLQQHPGIELFQLNSQPYAGFGSLKAQWNYNGPTKNIRFYPLNLYHAAASGNKPMSLKIIWQSLQAWNLHSYLTARKILQQEQPDIVHSHCLRALSVSVVSAVASLGIPQVHTIHDYELLSPWANLLRRGKPVTKSNPVDNCYTGLMRRLTRKIKTVIAPSNFALDLHLRRGFFPEASKYVLTNAFDLPDTCEINKPRKETLDILFVGTLRGHKGIMPLLEAFAHITSYGARLHIVGKGQLERVVADYASQDKRISYYGELAHGKQLQELYSLADILVMPSIWWENLPTVIIEAFSSGTAVIASNTGGIPEMITHGSNGLLFPAGDELALRQAILLLLNNRKLLCKLKENAFNSRVKYDYPKHLSSLIQIYKATLQPGRLR